LVFAYYRFLLLNFGIEAEIVGNNANQGEKRFSKETKELLSFPGPLLLWKDFKLLALTLGWRYTNVQAPIII